MEKIRVHGGNRSTWRKPTLSQPGLSSKFDILSMRTIQLCKGRERSGIDLHTNRVKAEHLSIALFTFRGLFHNLKHESKMIGDMLSDVSYTFRKSLS